MIRRHSLGFVVAILLATPAVQAQVIVVDSFDTPSPGVADQAITAVGPQRTDTGGSILEGGTRDLIVSTNSTLISGGTSNRYGIGDLGLTGSVLGISSNSTSSLEIVLDYHSFDGGSVNLSQMASFDLDFLELDPGFEPTLTVHVSLITSGGTFTASADFPASNTPTSYSIAASSFTGTGDLSEVTGIQVVLNDGGSPNVAGDFRLDAITIQLVPEPTSLVLWGLASVGGACWYRRRRATQVA